MYVPSFRVQQVFYPNPIINNWLFMNILSSCWIKLIYSCNLTINYVRCLVIYMTPSYWIKTFEKLLYFSAFNVVEFVWPPRPNNYAGIFIYAWFSDCLPFKLYHCRCWLWYILLLNTELLHVLLTVTMSLLVG